MLAVFLILNFVFERYLVYFVVQLLLLNLGFMPVDNKSASKQQILLASKLFYIHLISGSVYRVYEKFFTIPGLSC
jgi:hypothetical protein